MRVLPKRFNPKEGKMTLNSVPWVEKVTWTLLSTSWSTQMWTSPSPIVLAALTPASAPPLPAMGDCMPWAKSQNKPSPLHGFMISICSQKEKSSVKGVLQTGMEVHALGRTVPGLSVSNSCSSAPPFLSLTLMLYEESGLLWEDSPVLLAPGPVPVSLSPEVLTSNPSLVSLYMPGLHV